MLFLSKKMREKDERKKTVELPANFLEKNKDAKIAF
jgi:hypothetical protein